MDREIKVAVIGVGQFGQHHARIVNNQPARRLVFIVDKDLDRAGKIAELYTTTAIDSYKEIIGAVDAAIIASPTSTHFTIASDLLTSGIHIFIEKPIADSIEDAKQLVTIAQNKNLVLQVGQIERFNPAFLSIRKSIRNPVYIEARRTSPFPARIKDADVILDMMIHDIDIVLDLVKSGIKDIKAIGMKVLTDKIDMAQVRLEFESGVVANLSASRVSNNSFRKVRVFEKNRYFSIDFLNRSCYFSEIDTSNGRKEIKVTKPESHYIEPLQLELQNFFDAILGNENIGVTGVEACNALAAASKISSLIRDKI